MEQARRLSTPLSRAEARQLQAGQWVLLSGTVYGARDMAHRRLCEALERGQGLPFALEGAVVYFVGPTPGRPGAVIGAAGPTTSSRMDPFSPELVAAGLTGMIGKGYRSRQVREALQQYGAVHFAAIGGAGALLSKHIVGAEVIAYEQLGPEALWRLEVKDFPVVVAYDAHGGSVYEL